MKLIVFRVEDDKGLTILLKRHKKYKYEYDLNIQFQDLRGEQMAQFAPALYYCAITTIMLNEFNKGLRDLCERRKK